MHTTGSGLRNGLAAAALALLAACATAGGAARGAPPVELQLGLEREGWTRVREVSEGGMTVAEYVPRGETADAWTRFAAVHTFADAQVPFPGARWAVSEVRALLLERCPGATWTTLTESADDAVYEWRTAACAGTPDQHEVGRVMRVGDRWARVTFSAKGVMDAATRDDWLRRLRAAGPATGAG